jgi:hypothetical protein
MNPAVHDESPANSERLQLERWHGFANAATVALFGVPLINTTTVARAAWLELSQLLIGLGNRGRKPTHHV